MKRIASRSKKRIRPNVCLLHKTVQVGGDLIDDWHAKAEPVAINYANQALEGIKKILDPTPLSEEVKAATYKWVYNGALKHAWVLLEPSKPSHLQNTLGYVAQIPFIGDKLAGIGNLINFASNKIGL